ncbi:transcriptional regulator, TetR family [Klenkia marina]|uniref:Transcriptional regulator, TetR family n=1 Tax=Klenkia marina TaxID=1960309 RepID=A0A1G4YLE0_9ACTN|nr:TetR/AcrR family transcriptional regulator [Klenkia marina]SCX54139.1 transcriptional regulator, TetR family [Klenkia marina]
MARPRLHSPDAILDAAQDLLVAHGRDSLTVRALAERSGVSNGSIYHAFGSLETVVATTWLRRARDFLTLQQAAVAAELDRGDPRAAVLAAADAPARYAEASMPAAQLLTRLSRDDVVTATVDPTVATELTALDGAVAGTLRRLAGAVLPRADRTAVDVLTTCIVRLPGALLFPGIRRGTVDPLARRQLAAAVTAVLDVPLNDQETL